MSKFRKPIYSTDKDNKELKNKIIIIENDSKKAKFESAWEKICRENKEADERNSRNSKNDNNSSNFDPNRGW